MTMNPTEPLSDDDIRILAFIDENAGEDMAHDRPPELSDPASLKRLHDLGYITVTDLVFLEGLGARGHVGLTTRGETYLTGWRRGSAQG